MQENKVYTGIPGNDLPEKRVSLSEVSLGTGGGAKVKIYAFISNNLGNRTLTTSLPLAQFYDMSLIANKNLPNLPASEIAQRPLDQNHAKKLGLYILKGLVSCAIKIAKEKKESHPSWLEIQKELGVQAYEGMQPIVVNIRNCAFGGTDLMGTRAGGCWEIELEQGHKLWVVDGQHRRKGMSMMFEFLQNVRQRASYSKRDLFCPNRGRNASLELTNDEMALWETCESISRQNATISVEIHLGLNAIQERQLFHDMNNLVKRVDSNLALEFDTSNPVNTFAKEFLVEQLGIKVGEKEIKDWDDDDGSISRKELTSVNARLFLNKTNITGAKAELFTAGEEVAKQFWQAVAKIPGFGEEGAHKKTVAAQPVVLKALAKLAYDFALNRRKPANGQEMFEKLLAAIDQTGAVCIDFSHSNPMWRYYELTEEERDLHGLAGLRDYLPNEEEGNRDIGHFQDPYFRFGAKHNDIFPIIADMIRWRLGFPPRK